MNPIKRHTEINLTDVPYPINEYICEECGHRDSEHYSDDTGFCLVCDCEGLC